MKYSKDEVMQYVQEDDVKFIRLAFCDVFGKQKKHIDHAGGASPCL